MNARTIRRAAERKALKAARQTQRSEVAPPAEPTNPPAPATSPSPCCAAPRKEHVAGEPKTASPAQFAANRANAQLSTGPTSAEGKAISSRNHTTHGLTAVPDGRPFQVLPTENQSEYDNLLHLYKQDWKPATATEFDLVQRLATHAWLRHRAQRLEDEKLAQGMNQMQDYKQFEVLARYYNTHLRAYNKAFADLLRLKRFQMSQKKDEALLERRAQDVQIRFESQKRKAEEHAAKMESIRLKQEAQKQRNQRTKSAETVTPEVEIAVSESA